VGTANLNFALKGVDVPPKDKKPVGQTGYHTSELLQKPWGAIALRAQEAESILEAVRRQVSDG